MTTKAGSLRAKYIVIATGCPTSEFQVRSPSHFRMMNACVITTPPLFQDSSSAPRSARPHAVGPLGLPSSVGRPDSRHLFTARITAQAHHSSQPSARQQCRHNYVLNLRGSLPSPSRATKRALSRRGCPRRHRIACRSICSSSPVFSKTYVTARIMTATGCSHHVPRREDASAAVSRPKPTINNELLTFLAVSTIDRSHTSDSSQDRRALRLAIFHLLHAEPLHHPAPPRAAHDAVDSFTIIVGTTSRRSHCLISFAGRLAFGSPPCGPLLQ